MSGYEVLVTVVATAIGLGGWLWRVVRLVRARRLRPGNGAAALGVVVACCAALVFFLLRTGASEDVQNAPEYLFMYVALGLAWIWAAESLFSLFGISARDDVIERRNGAALIAVCGALVGVTLCYAGGNIGDGPGWWVVMFAAGLATIAPAVVWSLYELLTGGSEAITIDRDRAAGARLAGLLVACGLLFGRGVAGDWVSAALTLSDFVVVLPVAAGLLALAWIVERTARPTVERPRAPLASHGLVVALVYVGIAATYVARMGWPS